MANLRKYQIKLISTLDIALPEQFNGLPQPIFLVEPGGERDRERYCRGPEGQAQQPAHEPETGSGNKPIGSDRPPRGAEPPRRTAGRPLGYLALEELDRQPRYQQQNQQ